jgi:hypothetical protein
MESWLELQRKRVRSLDQTGDLYPVIPSEVRWSAATKRKSRDLAFQRQSVAMSRFRCDGKHRMLQLDVQRSHMRHEYRFYVYIVQSSSRRALYIGMTNNLHRRVFLHKTHRFEGSRITTTQTAWFIGRASTTYIRRSHAKNNSSDGTGKRS